MNDPLDDLFNGPKTADGSPRKAPPEHYVAPEARTFVEICIKCRGTGRFGRFGQCFACSGQGKRTFKTSQATRAKQRGRRQEVKLGYFEGLKAEHPEVHAWLVTHHGSNEFAASCWEAVEKFGSLSDGRLEAIKRSIAKDKARAEERTARVEAAPVTDTAGIDRLKLAFDTAIAKSQAKGRTFRWPRITIGDVVISPAKATSKNPGALYVKQGEQYLGKVAGGKFFAARECTAEQQNRVLAFIADPAKAAKLYGVETGVCCICNAALTTEESMSRGMGPVCAEKMGW
jgi:hypothetical protein